MNFSKKALRRCLSLTLALAMVTTLFAGCKKDGPTEDTSKPQLNLDLDLTGTSAPSETTSEPVETTAPKINENTATVTSTINVRSSPSTEAIVTGTLEAGDKVEISRLEGVTGIDWAYIISPISGWINMEFVEMDIPRVEAPGEDTSTPAGSADPTEPKDETNTATNTTNIKAVVNVNGLNIRSAPSTENTKIQGTYYKGDVVTILETKNGWGRTNKGWIKMEYVSTSGTTTSTNNTTTTTNTNVTSNGSTTVVAKGIVKTNDLNIRSEASINGDRLGNYTYGQRVEFLEKSGSWGRTNKGWISLDYVYMDGNTGTKTANGTVTASELLIRSGPGKDYTPLGSYKSGDSVSVLEQFTYNGVTWGCTNKGWICMDYVNTGSTTTNNTTSTDSKTGTITGNGLRIRSGAGTDYGTVGSLNAGDRVTILEQKVVGNTTWGKISQGWISMTYVKLD